MRAGVKGMIVAIASSCFVQSPAAADAIVPLTRPDPAGVTAPDLAFKPTYRDTEEYDYFFYFHKPGVSYEQAFADLDMCRLYGLQAQLVRVPPGFVPIGTADVARPEVHRQLPVYTIGGVIGFLIVDMIVAAAEEDARAATNRRCMFYKGYVRYGTSKAIFKQIDAGSDADRLARQARIASGPLPPQAEALAP